jgi:hypothetical protein
MFSFLSHDLCIFFLQDVHTSADSEFFLGGFKLRLESMFASVLSKEVRTFFHESFLFSYAFCVCPYDLYLFITE